MNIEAYPTFRLYTGKDKFAEFEHPKLKLRNMKKWLKANGATFDEADEADDADDKKEDKDELKSIMLEKLKLVFWDKLQDELKEQNEYIVVILMSKKEPVAGISRPASG